MLRRRPPVLAEVAGGPSGDGSRLGALRRADIDAFGRVLGGLGGRRLVLTTATDGDGAAVAVGLAAAAVAAGRRAALVECDLARPALAAALGLRPAPGLHEYLRGEVAPRRILQPLVAAGPAATGAAHPLVCVVAGGSAGRGEGLLASARLRHALAKLRSAYETVVLAGPGLERPELAAVAAEADATVCVAGQALPRRLPVPVTGFVQRS